MERPPVVILSGVRWDFLWQRHQDLATLFSRAGYPTVFVETTGLANPHPNRETLRKVASRLSRAGGEGSSAEEGLTVYSPFTAPPTYGVFRWLNRRFFVPRVVKDLGKNADPVVIAYPPTRTTLEVISGLHPRLVLYDCSDDYAHFPGAPRDIAATERELLRRADLVSCTSTWLLEKVRAVRPDAFLSGPAVDYEHFAILQNIPPPSDGEVRTVCFFGSLSRERIDLCALRAIAEAGFEVRIVGGLRRVGRDLLELPGIDYRGEVPHAKLPSALVGVDAFVLPYRVNGLTRGISPAKTYECLATGRPVVAAPLSALEELAGFVYLAARPRDYVEVLQSLKNLETERGRRARIELARGNSWGARFEEIEEALWRIL